MLPIMTMLNLMEYNDSLFNGVVIPTGSDRKALVDTILRNYGEMPVTIPDWSAFRYYVGSWFSAHSEQFNKLWRAYTVEYNPIWNKDGEIIETRTPDLVTQTEAKRTPDLTNTITYDSNVTTTDTGDDVTQTKGFNSSAFVDLNKEIPNLTNEVDRTGTDTTTQTGEENNSATVTEKGTDVTVRKETGNIGITSTQQMLNEEIDLNKRFNFYETIASLFAQDFCVMIY